MHCYYLPAILIILIGGEIINFIIEKLDVAHSSNLIPKEFEGWYDPEKYAKSQAYLKEKAYFGIAESAVFTFGAAAFILGGWFNLIDNFARSLGLGRIMTGLIFFGIIYLVSYLGSIPFSAYRTFVIEERYGFNRTTPRIFIGDLFKHLFLVVVVGGIALSAVLWFFGFAGRLAWLYSWATVTILELFFIFIAPVTILPLFNKFTPLEEGELKKAIMEYAASQDFKIRAIYKMDASRRSTKSNAFFTGLGKYKRIVLFDTLVNKMKADELVAVLAHEVGHYKHRDIFKGLAISLLSTGAILFMMSFFILNSDLAAAFKMERVSIYAGLFFFTFLYSPINWLFGIVTNYITRHFESAADKFAVDTYKRPHAMINALKRLSVDNLSNLTPHPIKVFVSYSHPPAAKRIEAIRKRF